MLFQNFLLLDLLVYSLYIGIYGILIIIFLIRTFKSDKVAQPFLLSLVFYFVCLSVGAILLYLDNRATVWGSEVGGTGVMFIYSSFSLALLIIASIPLIFILEKNIFQNSILKEKHMVTIIQLFMISIFFIIVFLPQTVTSGGLVPFYLLIILIQVIFFTGGFLYIGIKSTGYVKRLCLLVALSYLCILLSNGANFLLSNQLRAGSVSLDDFLLRMGFLFSLRSFFTIIMSYGLIKLYMKKY